MSICPDFENLSPLDRVRSRKLTSISEASSVNLMVLILEFKRVWKSFSSSINKRSVSVQPLLFQSQKAFSSSVSTKMLAKGWDTLYPNSFDLSELSSN